MSDIKRAETTCIDGQLCLDVRCDLSGGCVLDRETACLRIIERAVNICAAVARDQGTLAAQRALLLAELQIRALAKYSKGAPDA